MLGSKSTQAVLVVKARPSLSNIRVTPYSTHLWPVLQQSTLPATKSCTSKIACAGTPPTPPPPSPPPAPSPVPPPPPASCSCVLLWWNDDNCTHTSETSARAMGGQCNDFRPPFSKGLSVRLNSKCEYLQAFNSTTCGRPSISQVTHTNKCVPFSTGGSIMVACDNN
eukprot:TRINITY_DN67164_c6_g1_i4.p2 TRINITY_DN67164_c6_g1~~TRINITY_DN67164_c6_g1_i4.p2  ORF type:complete len:167 (-),score=30.18 TRINITY_DN67164_c6_g1_i4:17-517(-)